MALAQQWSPPLGRFTHIIRNGEFMGAGWWTGIQTWVRDKCNQGESLTLESLMVFEEA